MTSKIHFVTLGAERLECDLADHDVPTAADLLSLALGYGIAASTHTPPQSFVLCTDKPHRNEGASAAFLRSLSLHLLNAAAELERIHLNRQTSNSRAISAPVDCDPAMFLNAVEASGMMPEAQPDAFGRYIRKTQGNA